MARKPKSVYERIEEKEQEILETKELLQRLNEELVVLNNEKDDLEMHQLFELMRAKGLSINEAVELLHSSNTQQEEDKKTKRKSRKEPVEDLETVTE